MRARLAKVQIVKAKPVAGLEIAMERALWNCLHAASSRFPSLSAPFQGPPAHLTQIPLGAKGASRRAAATARCSRHNGRSSDRISTCGRSTLSFPMTAGRRGAAGAGIPGRRTLRQAATILRFDTRGQGFYPITPALEHFIAEQRIETGLLTIFCRHTSASLLIQENADPDVLADLESFFRRIAPEGGQYRHDMEGPDDMPAHIRAALTQTQLS